VKVTEGKAIEPGEYFEKLDKEAGGKQTTEIEYVGGSVEAACALGLADGIGESKINWFRKIFLGLEMGMW